METNLSNRMAKPQGRPPVATMKPPEPVTLDLTQLAVPPLICPGCGRGMNPHVERRRPDGKADCVCTLNGCKFVYTPATVRNK